MPDQSKLFIPNKNAAGDDNRQITIALRTIERWANGLKFGGGGGGAYASLTGPGETTTPGKLTQAGGFVVNDTASNGVQLNETVPGGTNTIDLNGPNNTIAMSSQYGYRIFSQSTDTGNGIEIYEYGPAGIAIVNVNSGALQLVQDGLGGIFMNDNGGHGVAISSGNPLGGSPVAGPITLQTGNGGGDLTLAMLNGYLIFNGLPIVNPGGTNRVWNNGGVLNIT